MPKVSSMRHIDKVTFIQKHLKEIEKLDLPTLPTIYHQVADLIQSGQATVLSLSEVVSSDPVITAKILMIVNSASYGLRQEITTLQRAINILGYNELSSLVLSSTVVKIFRPSQDTHFSIHKFWEHSIAVAVAARIIARKLHRKFNLNPQEAFTAGLLHDIGKLVEKEFYPGQFSKALAHCRHFKATLVQAEDQIFGYNHQHIGHALVREWNLPAVYHSAIGFHHRPETVDSKHAHYAVIATVHLANAFAKVNLLGSGGDPFIPHIEESTLNYLELNLGDIETLLRDIEIESREATSILLGKSNP
jgi:putative nucleotidyltransferase with HDIG domain